MMGYESCVDWCHNHPALLTILLILSIIFPLVVYASTRDTTNLVNPSISSCPHATLDIEKQALPQDVHIHPPGHQSWPAWPAFLAVLRPGRSTQQAVAVGGEDVDIQAQEKTPLIGSMTGDHEWSNGSQFTNNWHGTNQLNTSWGYMA